MKPAQIAFAFPPPMTARQLAAAAELERMVAERRATFAVQQFAQRRRAGKRGWAKRRGAA